MRILLFKHFAFDEAAVITDWAAGRKHEVIPWFPPDSTAFPDLSQFDCLIILGGPMSVYQESEHPWLIEEKRFIRSAVEAGKRVLGICLGAQLLTEVLGGKVVRNPHKEIGWHPMKRTERRHPLLDGLLELFYSIHWHGVACQLPSHLEPLAYSDACGVQAFAYGERVLGLQFHLETTPTCMDTMLNNWSDELVEGPYIQNASTMRAEASRSADSAAFLSDVLERLEQIEI